MTDRPHLLWIDLETTGLDPDHLDVLEFAARFTDWEGEPTSDMFIRVGQLPDGAVMDPFVRDMHTASGLLDACNIRGFDEHKIWVALADWAADVLDSLPAGTRVLLAGSGIGHFDREIIRRRSNLLDLDGMDYRILDVSVLRTALGTPKKKAAHRAADDVADAINEWRSISDLLAEWSRAAAELDRERDVSAHRGALVRAGVVQFGALSDYACRLSAEAQADTAAAVALGRVLGYADALREDGDR